MSDNDDENPSINVIKHIVSRGTNEASQLFNDQQMIELHEIPKHSNYDAIFIQQAISIIFDREFLCQPNKVATQVQSMLKIIKGLINIDSVFACKELIKLIFVTDIFLKRLTDVTYDEFKIRSVNFHELVDVQLQNLKKSHLRQAI